MITHVAAQQLCSRQTNYEHVLEFVCWGAWAEALARKHSIVITEMTVMPKSSTVTVSPTQSWKIKRYVQLYLRAEVYGSM